MNIPLKYKLSIRIESNVLSEYYTLRFSFLLAFKFISYIARVRCARIRAMLKRLY